MAIWPLAWWDRLPPSEQERVAQLAAEVGTTSRLLPADQGDTLHSQLLAAQARFLSLRDPFYLVRAGDAELALLGAGFWPHGHTYPTDFYLQQAGLDRDAIRLRPEFIRSLAGAHLLGVQQNWPGIRENMATLLRMAGIPVPAANMVEVHLPYLLLANGSLFGWCRSKSVLLVGALAGRLGTAFRDPTFVAAYRPLEADKIYVAGSVTTPPRGGGCWRVLDGIMAEVARHRFDIALVSAGTPGKVLCRRIWEMGRVALDVGFVFDALLGHPERERRPILRDVRWPV